jgi:hypothetical protein
MDQSVQSSSYLVGTSIAVPMKQSNVEGELVENEDDVDSHVFVDFIRPCLAEFIGTLLLVLMGK